jgi:hypothetical protein
MKIITRLSLLLIMFSLLSISYLVTSVSAQNKDCTKKVSASEREECEKNNANPGSAAAGNTTQNKDCTKKVSASEREECEKNNANPGSSAAGQNKCFMFGPGTEDRIKCDKGSAR